MVPKPINGSHTIPPSGHLHLCIGYIALEGIVNSVTLCWVALVYPRLVACAFAFLHPRMMEWLMLWFKIVFCRLFGEEIDVFIVSQSKPVLRCIGSSIPFIPDNVVSKGPISRVFHGYN